MRIVKEEQGLMVLKDRNAIIFVMGIVFAFVGLIIIFKPELLADQPPIALGVIVALLGGFIVFVTKIITVTIDKSSNRLSFSRKNLLGEKNKEYNLNQIKEVELSVSCHSSKSGGGRSYHLSFVLDNGEIVPLNPGNSSIIRVVGIQIIPEKALGTKIANFLGVPFQEKRPPTVAEILSTVSSAIQNVAEREMDKQKKL